MATDVDIKVTVEPAGQFHLPDDIEREAYENLRRMVITDGTLQQAILAGAQVHCRTRDGGEAHVRLVLWVLQLHPPDVVRGHDRLRSFLAPAFLEAQGLELARWHPLVASADEVCRWVQWLAA